MNLKLNNQSKSTKKKSQNINSKGDKANKDFKNKKDW